MGVVLADGQDVVRSLLELSAVQIWWPPKASPIWLTVSLVFHIFLNILFTLLVCSIASVESALDNVRRCRDRAGLTQLPGGRRQDIKQESASDSHA